MRATNRLSAFKVRNASPGKHADGAGLWLHQRNDGGAQWFLRVVVHGRRREMGLGPLADVGLKEARQAAERWRAIARSGKDPIKERERLRREAAKSDNTLAHVATEAFEARKAELKNDGVSGRWFSPLKLHVLPKLGKTPIEELDQQDIKNTLAPIWHSKGETAKKAMGRLAIVFRHAAAMGLDVDLQATEKAKALLGRSRQERRHIPALPWQEVPAFYDSINNGTLTHLALRLLILTTIRSGPLRLARWEQFDGDVWEVPAENMKGMKGKSRSLRIPLSEEARTVLHELRPFERNGFLFPGVRKGVMSDRTMTGLMETRGMEARPHGFRSSFRDWCAEVTDTPREIAETALAHISGGKVELAYRRTDFLEQRRILMERWARHVSGHNSEVVRLATK